MSSTAAREVTIASAQSVRGASLRRWRAGPVPWMLPAIIVLGLFYLYPVFDVLRLSFTDATLIGDHENYTLSSIVSTLTSSRLPGVLLATLIFVGGSVVGQQILGLIIALVVNRGEQRNLLGTTLLRTTALVAWVVPGIAGGIVWQMLFSEAPFGAINSLLRLLQMKPVANGSPILRWRLGRPSLPTFGAVRPSPWS